MTATAKPRLALYSPGVVGLGHFRRNLLIAQTLAESRLDPVTLLVAEAREASAYVETMPEGMDCVTLPGLSKDLQGICRPRYLDLPLKEVLALRGRTIRASLKAFEPDLLIVDHLPRGAYRELDPALKQLKLKGRTRCVLGLRDVLDEPWSVHRDWFRWKFDEAIEEYYDAIWIYGDPAVYNMVEEYRFPPTIAAKMRFVGYLDQRQRLRPGNVCELQCGPEAGLPEGRLFLCLLGGGQGGERLAETFAQTRFPADTWGLIVTGPFMSQEGYARLRQRCAQNPRLRLIHFLNEPTRMVERAERVIAMGGYNTVCEVLSFGKPALLIPRPGPRREQLIRAQRLQELGRVEMLELEELSAGALSAWMAREPICPAKMDAIDLGGLDRLPGFAAELLRISRSPTPAPNPAAEPLPALSTL